MVAQSEEKFDMGNVLAVIPARKEDDKIPNRNVRIVAGHPLIYYTIKTALASKYITDIIVTTDSDEIQIIAEEMGVQCRKRSPKLCVNSVSLDEVVYDAVPDTAKWEYIVTMEPVCPLLRTETVDNAICFMKNNELDTLISAKKSYVFLWKSEKNGKKSPDFNKRMNFALMDPGYIECGAFLICKGAVLSHKTRIGEKIDLFEVPKLEAEEVTNLFDLQNIDSILSCPNVAIYVNGNSKRGLGHIYRALDLADEFFTTPVIYYDKSQTKREYFGNISYQLVPIDGMEDLLRHCEKEKYTLFINDVLNTSKDYMIKLKRAMPCAKIINFEDDGEGKSEADLVVNALYASGHNGNVCGGEKYYIAKRLFLLYEPILIREKVKRIIITFGGADPQNYTDRLIRIIKKREYNNYHFTVVLGRAKENIDELMEFNQKDNIDVLYDVSNMAALMCSCDLAFTSRGRTGYELAMLGIPTIAMAQNELEEKHSFICDDNGYIYLGLNPTDNMIEETLKMCLLLSKSNRQKLQNKLLQHDLRNGRRRVMNAIRNLY